MKRIDPLARLFTAVVATGMMLAPQLRAENVPQVVEVIRVEGRAQWSTDSRNWMDLKTGDVLKPGTVIRTSEKSLVDVVLGDRDSVGNIPVAMASPTAVSAASGGGGGGGGDETTGNVVRIFSMTVLGVDKLILDRTGVDDVSDTQLDLRAGQIFVNVKKLSKQSRYEVKIPNGVAGIRGTGTLISSTGLIKTAVGSTIIALFKADGSLLRLEVPAGHQFDPNTGVVTEMSPGDIKILEFVLNELNPIIQQIVNILKHDHTIFFCTPVDGSAAH